MPDPVDVRLELRWSDLDAQGHVNNVVFLELLQEARVRVLLDGPAEALVRDGVVVTNHQVEYLHPLRLGAVVCARTGLASVGAARFTFAYELLQDGVVCARARTTCCPFDLSSQRPRVLRADERSQLQGLLGEAEPLRVVPRPSLSGHGYAVPLRARWSDLDRFGHVNNVTYLDYLQEGRIRMMEAVLPGVAVTGELGSVWFVVRQDVDYLAQVNYRASAWCVRTAVVGVGRTSLTLASEICDSESDDARVHARSTVVLVHADADAQPQPVPPALVDALSAWRLPRL